MGFMITNGLSSKKRTIYANETVFSSSDCHSDVFELDEDSNSLVNEEIHDQEEKISSNQKIAVPMDKSLFLFHRESFSELYFKQLSAPPECEV